MGQPAEARALVAHLLNVRLPYDYANPDFALLCQGISELTENFEADTEDVQYICETTKTTNTKGYRVGFDLSMGSRQVRTKGDLRLCGASAGKFFVIRHKNLLKYESIPSSFLCNLPKNLPHTCTATSVWPCLYQKQ